MLNESAECTVFLVYKSELRRAEIEGETGRQQASLLQTRLIQLEEEMHQQATAEADSGQLPCQQCASYARDVAELRSVQEKLQVKIFFFSCWLS